jgi:hypothetical protein
LRAVDEYESALVDALPASRAQTTLARVLSRLAREARQCAKENAISERAECEALQAWTR